MQTRAMHEREIIRRLLDFAMTNRLTMAGNLIPLLNNLKSLLIWDSHVKNFLIEKVVDHFVIDQNPPLHPLPEMETDFVSSAQAKFSLSVVQSKVGPNVAPIVMGKATAREAYNTLKDHHSLQCRSKLDDLQENFFTYSKGSKTIIEMSNDIRAMIFDLRAAGETITSGQEWRALTRAV